MQIVIILLAIIAGVLLFGRDAVFDAGSLAIVFFAIFGALCGLGWLIWKIHEWVGPPIDPPWKRENDGENK